MNRHVLLVIGWFLFTFAQGATADCADCVEDLQLDRKELDCARHRIDDWIDQSKASGVLELVMKPCGDARIGRSAELGPIPMRGDDAGGEHDNRQVRRLSTEQLICLKDYLPDLMINQRNHAFFHFSACRI